MKRILFVLLLLALPSWAAITRTAQGTAQEKVSDTSLTCPSAAFDPGESDRILIYLVVDSGGGTITATFDGQAMTVDADNTAGGVTTMVFSLSGAGRASSQATITLGTAVTAKACVALTITGGNGVPTFLAATSASGTFDAAVTAPSQTCTPNSGADCFWGLAIGVEGPDEDAIPTYTNPNNVGQSLGTTGGLANSNVTMEEGFEINSGSVTQAASATLDQSRSWLTQFVTYMEPAAGGGPTRLYLPLPTCRTPPVTVPFTLQASWNDTDGADRAYTTTTKCNTALTDRVEAKANTANTRALMRQWVSPPLSGNQTISGTVKGTVRALESAINDNIDKVSLKLLVVTNNGQSLGNCGTALLVLGDYGPTTEWDTVLENRRIADGDTITTCAALNGERIVIEIGFTNTTSGTSITGTQNFGDDNASDCLDDQTTQSACNPFIEFSVGLTFGSEVSARRRVTISSVINNPMVIPELAGMEAK